MATIFRGLLSDGQHHIIARLPALALPVVLTPGSESQPSSRSDTPVAGSDVDNNAPHRQDSRAPDVRSPLLRRAGKDLLSLALMDARNQTLRWLSAYEAALASDGWRVPVLPDISPPLWEAGHIAWFQEYWIGRHVQRQRGTACDPTGIRLASIQPRADAWYDPARAPHERRWALDLPDLQRTKDYLADTLEITLDLLDATDTDVANPDAVLYFHRLALFHEDMLCERLASMAQTLGMPLRASVDAPSALHDLLPALNVQSSNAQRPPLAFVPARWTLGVSRGDGFVFDNEVSAHDIKLPEFEIDSQAVSWAQYADFVEDGGYDDDRWWSADGWQWAQQQERRAPRHVAQIRQGVLQRRFGVLVHLPMQQPVVHVSWYEAEAWCAWAGRRLPTEVEWEAAAHLGARRGFRWGDVWEWTATTFRPYPGFRPDPDRSYSEPCFGTHKVLRGASCATSGRLRDPKYRYFLRPERDDVFCGFRSCAV
ncbi:MAG: SUMF1/EgtB/PvdO family nonheme iron enzyme [Burkholderiaceae bacterium]|nr:SUMF1/EgtB/PvdO family nonheme iron enzyme [Burkholderiaceae bacterium]